MPPDAQNAIARAMLDMAGIGTPGDSNHDHLADVLAGLEEIVRGDIATPEEVEAAFRRFEA
ncbi:hypothetical protein MKK75_24845 [Methylobacterium sp. J-030]|uniref:hypothetical protein n=1 Tax=Methylobacterium sp. J-030 TaxID=2836627 RepID=UPI001FBB8215|nr:hypothetical protein [Methylobacterium sp. J-030]MCJ2071991.1 hypothetical protein [Methylobacterium sp. J-030]